MIQAVSWWTMLALMGTVFINQIHWFGMYQIQAHMGAMGNAWEYIYGILMAKSIYSVNIVQVQNGYRHQFIEDYY